MAKSRKSVSKDKPVSDAADDISETASDALKPEISETSANVEVSDSAKTDMADAIPESAKEDPAGAEERADVAPADDIQGEVEISQEVKEGEIDAAASEHAKTAEDGKSAEDLSDIPETEESEREKAESEAVATQMVPVPPARPEPSRSVFWPMVFGGIVAGALGFIAGRSDVLDAYLPASMQRGQVDLAALEASLAGQTASLTAEAEAQAARIASLEERPEAPEVNVDLSGVTEELASLEARLAALEQRPEQTPSSQDDGSAAEIEALRQMLASLEAGLAQQQATLDAQAAEIAALSAKADAATDAARSEAASILARAALTRVVTAVETGDTFTPALGDLEETTAVEIPDALRQAAEAGVPTLSALQAEFPDAARAGLAAARAAQPESEMEGIGGFLRRQLGARSLTPRDGSDPDAVLSRAEAALRAGDLNLALSEMEALPDAAKSAMQTWLDAARSRQAAEDAAKSLADSLQSN